MTLIITLAAIAIVAGTASLVRAVRQAPEGVEQESGFSPALEATHLALVAESGTEVDARPLVIRGVSAA